MLDGRGDMRLRWLDLPRDLHDTPVWWRSGGVAVAVMLMLMVMLMVMVMVMAAVMSGSSPAPKAKDLRLCGAFLFLLAPVVLGPCLRHLSQPLAVCLQAFAIRVLS
jgi:hypothetical protein